MKVPIEVTVLLALRECDGQPITESALVAAVKLGAAPQPDEATILQTLAALKARGMVSGFSGLAGRTWGITEKGRHELAGGGL